MRPKSTPTRRTSAAPSRPPTSSAISSAGSSRASRLPNRSERPAFGTFFHFRRYDGNDDKNKSAGKVPRAGIPERLALLAAQQLAHVLLFRLRFPITLRHADEILDWDEEQGRVRAAVERLACLSSELVVAHQDFVAAYGHLGERASLLQPAGVAEIERAADENGINTARIGDRNFAHRGHESGLALLRPPGIAPVNGRPHLAVVRVGRSADLIG